MLEKNQILISISEDKRKITIEAGAVPQEITYDACPAKVLENIGNVITAFSGDTGLYYHPEWENEKCGYLGGKCRDCN